MSRTNASFQNFSRGLLSPKALARVDVERTRLSAEVYENWLPATQGSMSIRPGTKHFGNSLSDTGAEFLEFVASVDDVALVELTHNKMRLWIGSDAHNLALLGRPAVDTTVTLLDTGWADASTGGAIATGSASADIIPTMTGPTTSGVTITAKSEVSVGEGGLGWHAADDDATDSEWHDTGVGWWNVDYGSGNTKAVTGYSVRAGDHAGDLPAAPASWRLLAGDYDTGTFATDTGKWLLQDERSGQTGWAILEKRSFTTPEGDTGTVTAYRHWRLFFTARADAGSGGLVVREIENFSLAVAQQTHVDGSALYLNATSIGALAKRTKRVIVSDTGTEHALAITVDRGPVTLRVGSTDGADDYISETEIGTGYHDLAFTPNSDFWITLQSDALIDRIVGSLAISDTGTVELTAPWARNDLDNVRYDQSADVVYVDCKDVRPSKIERRGTGRSWSVVDYVPDNGPFLSSPSSSAKLSLSHFFGNATLNSDIPFFTADHEGALIRAFHEGQSGQWRLGALDAKTDAIEITGINDTGTGAGNERQATISVSGVYTGSIVIERSFNGAEQGFTAAATNFLAGSAATDTGTFSRTLRDADDNVKVWYRARMTAYTSGVAVVAITYAGGGVTGIARITGYNSNTDVDVEVLSRFSDTGTTDNWQQGYWSTARGFPTAVALHGGRLGHGQGGSLFLSVSDDYENFDDTTVGESGPIIRTLGSGAVDAIRYLVSLLRLIIGTAGGELAARSSSLDEPLTPDNSAAVAFSTQGSANLRAVKMDTRALMVQRSGQRLYMLGPAQNTLADYQSFDLTLLVPDLLAAGAVSVAVQRQPDTRLHVALADGTVAILTYEPDEEVLCWSTWSTDGSVERVSVLPGTAEDAVYYHIRRVIGDGNDSYTKVLLSFDGSDGSTTFADINEGGTSHAWTASGDAQIDTVQSKFGGASLLCDGTGDVVTSTDVADLEFGSAAFTIDLWFNCTATTGSIKVLAGKETIGSGGTNAERSWAVFRNASDTITAIVYVGSTSYVVNGTTTFTDAANTGWHHLAFVRSGDTLKLFIDGSPEGGDVPVSGSVNDLDGVMSVGALGEEGNYYWQGWIDEFRLSIGIARWTEAFTTPTMAYGKAYRFLEKWAKESECLGDTGLSWLADCASSYEGAAATLLDGVATHLVGENLVVWGSLDTGSTPFVDLSPDTGSGSDPSQRLWPVDTGGDITLTGLTTGVVKAVVGLPYQSLWASSKLAYGAEAGTALAQMKRVAQGALVLYKTHQHGLRFGTGDTGATLDKLPPVINGAVVDNDTIHQTLDKVAVPMPGGHDTDPRLILRGRAPRPCTVLALVSSVQTNERV